MPREAMVAYLARHAAAAPVRCGGHAARRPAAARRQDCHSPAELPPGGVLIIGSGQSGYQIAEERLCCGGRGPAHHSATSSSGSTRTAAQHPSTTSPAPSRRIPTTRACSFRSRRSWCPRLRARGPRPGPRCPGDGGLRRAAEGDRTGPGSSSVGDGIFATDHDRGPRRHLLLVPARRAPRRRRRVSHRGGGGARGERARRADQWSDDAGARCGRHHRDPEVGLPGGAARRLLVHPPGRAVDAAGATGSASRRGPRGAG